MHSKCALVTVVLLAGAVSTLIAVMVSRSSEKDDPPKVVKETTEDYFITAVSNTWPSQSSGTCSNPSWIGDDYCDDENNVEICHFDGGDCCNPKASHETCTNCLCLSNFSMQPEENSTYSSCFDPSWAEDGFCDDENNNKECIFDGGDCCNPNASHEFCKVCQCLDTPFSTKHATITFAPSICFNTAWIGDGFCDDNQNIPDCQYDGGDCCNEDASHSFCKECECLDPIHSTPHVSICINSLWVGDDVCDDETNIKACQYDGGDCCNPNASFDLCTICNCKKGAFDPWHVPTAPPVNILNQKCLYNGDNICDDLYNTAKCNFDSGDCCNPSANYEFCSECLCLTPMPTHSCKANCKESLLLKLDPK